MVVGLFTFLTCWNAFLFALMFTDTPASQTLSIGVALFATSALPAGSARSEQAVVGEAMLFGIGKRIRRGEGETIRRAAGTGRRPMFDAATGRNLVCRNLVCRNLIWSTP